MFTQTASAATLPSGISTPRAYRPSPVSMASAVTVSSFQTLVALVSWTSRWVPSDSTTSRVLPLIWLTRPSMNDDRETAGSREGMGAAKAASASRPPSAEAPTMVAPPRAALVRMERRSMPWRPVMAVVLLTRRCRREAGRS